MNDGRVEEAYTLGVYVRRRRIDHQWTQTELGRRLGERLDRKAYTQAHVHRIESGEARLSSRKSRATVEALGAILDGDASVALWLAGHERGPVSLPSPAALFALDQRLTDVQRTTLADLYRLWGHDPHVPPAE